MAHKETALVSEKSFYKALGFMPGAFVYIQPYKKSRINKND